MVYPEIEFIDTGDGKKLPLQRIRRYENHRSTYEAILQPQSNEKSIPLVRISKKLMSTYKGMEIFFVTKKKIRIKSKIKEDINTFVSDEEFRKNFEVYIPPELCETKAVVDIPADADFNEKYIYDNLNIKHFPEYGIMKDTKIVEVKRFTIPSEDNKRLDIDLVMITFSGDMLPSHVMLDNIIFPVRPFVEKIVQCSKCWRHGHSAKVCRRIKSLCHRCGQSHDGECFNMPVCVNCNAFHDAKFNGCEVEIRLRKQNREKAENKDPMRSKNVHNQEIETNVFTFNENDFPTISNKRPKLTATKSRKRKNKIPMHIPANNNEIILSKTFDGIDCENNIALATGVMQENTKIITNDATSQNAVETETISLTGEVSTYSASAASYTSTNTNLPNNTKTDNAETKNKIISKIRKSNSLEDFEKFQQSLKSSENFNPNPLLRDYDENFSD